MPPLLSLQVSCLCGPASCLLCGCCPSARNSTVSRLLFTFFLFLCTLVSIIMIIPGVEKELYKVTPAALAEVARLDHAGEGV